MAIRLAGLEEMQRREDARHVVQFGQDANARQIAERYLASPLQVALFPPQMVLGSGECATAADFLTLIEEGLIVEKIGGGGYEVKREMPSGEYGTIPGVDRQPTVALALAAAINWLESMKCPKT